MQKSNHNNCIRVMDTVSAFNAPESIFQPLAERASDFIVHHNERKSCMDEGTHN